jgi:hypothetical protein
MHNVVPLGDDDAEFVNGSETSRACVGIKPRIHSSIGSGNFIMPLA